MVEVVFRPARMRARAPAAALLFFSSAPLFLFFEQLVSSGTFKLSSGSVLGLAPHPALVSLSPFCFAFEGLGVLKLLACLVLLFTARNHRSGCSKDLR